MRQTCLVIRRTAETFIADKRGGIFLLIAFALLPLMGALGLASDAARGYMVKEKLSRALDIAALAGAKVIQSPDLNDQIQMYFRANFPTDYMNTTVVGPTPKVSSDNLRISLTARASMPTSFMRVFGQKTLDVSASTEVTVGAKPIDLVLAVDMSGSMGWSAGSGGGTRIAAARTAATTLMNTLYGDADFKSGVRVGLVPWNSKVNVGLDGVAYKASETTTEPVAGFNNPITGNFQSQVWAANNSPVPLLFEPPANWTGCVYARYTHDGNDGNDGDSSYGSGTYDNKDWFAWEPVGAGSGGSTSNKKKKKKSSSCGAACSSCLDHGITPMQESRTAIIDQVKGLTSPRGNTVIVQGLAWAWRVLMPEAPFSNDTPPEEAPRRAIVLLTDGEHCGGNGDAYKDKLGGCDGSRAELNARLRTLATRIKAQDIEIYAIQFANGGGDLEDLMKDVASSRQAPYYQFAPDAAALDGAFQRIGDELTSMHISR